MVLPLDSLVVVEVSSFVAGPAMGSLLHELGADVIKIEQPTTGDPSRVVSPWGFLNYNYGKKSLSLNLKSKAGQEILHRLISRKKPDIFIENMGADVVHQLGFSYPVLSKLNPNIIYCSIKGFSSKSQYYDRPAFDAVAQAMSGIMSLTGEPNGEPVRVGNPSIDLGAAAYGTIEVLSAILQCQRSKKGKFIEISLFDMSAYWNGYWLTYFGMTGIVPRRLGSGHLAYSPHRAFKTKDNRYVLIATLSDAQWKKLSSLLEIKIDSSYDNMKYRLAHKREIEQAIQDAIAQLNTDEVLGRLGQYVPCAPVRSIDEVYNDEELYKFGVLRDMTNTFDDHNKSTVYVASPPVNHRRSATKERKVKTALSVPQIGQDNKKILKSIGYTRSEIEEFMQLGIL